MKRFVRVMGCVATALALGIGLNVFAASWFGSERSTLQVGRWFLFEVRRSEALQQRADLVAQSWESKQDVIADLVAGRVPLREAIVRFKQANDLVTSSDQGMVATYYTPSDRESLGRQVLAWVHNEVSTWPPHKAQRILISLECEFQELFDRSSSENLSGVCPEEEQAPAVVAD